MYVCTYIFLYAVAVDEDDGDIAIRHFISWLGDLPLFKFIELSYTLFKFAQFVFLIPGMTSSHEITDRLTIINIEQE